MIISREKVAVGEIPVGEFILFDKFKIYYSERIKGKKDTPKHHFFYLYEGWGCSKLVLEKFYKVDLIVLKITNITNDIPKCYYLLITPESFIQNSSLWNNKEGDLQLICPEDKFVKIGCSEEVRKILAKFFRF